MSIKIKYKITDNVSDAVWLGALILTYEQKSNCNNIVFKQSEIRKAAQSLCHKNVQPARVHQWCNGDNHSSTFNYLREEGSFRRLTRMGEFNGQKEYPSNISELIKLDTEIIINNIPITIKELYYWYVYIYSKIKEIDCKENTKEEKESMKNRNISIKLNDVLYEFEKIEKYYKELCSDALNDALNIEDIDKSKEIIDDSFEKIRKISKWKDVIFKVNEEILNSNIPINTISKNIDDSYEENDVKNFDDDDDNNDDDDEGNNNDNFGIEDVQNTQIIEDNVDDKNIEETLCDNQSDEPTKIGLYIRNKMRQLSAEGYTFDKDALNSMSSLGWSKRTLGLGVPFIKIYVENKPLSLQTCDDSGYNRHWHEIFNFGEVKLIITSQWYEKQRISFDKWYNLQLEQKKLNELNNIKEQDDETDEIKPDDLIQDYTNTSPANIIILGRKYNVSSWKDVLVKVCESMILKRPYIAAKFNKEKSLQGKNRINFSYNENDIKFSGVKLSNGLWVETNKSANEIYRYAIKILGVCGYSGEDYSGEDLIINLNE